MIVKIESEKIAEIKNALQIIMSNAELISMRGCLGRKREKIIKQVKRIDRLLPQVKFEG